MDPRPSGAYRGNGEGMQKLNLQSGDVISGAVLAAFSGVITDPLQRRLGLHRRRLSRLLDALERGLCSERAQHVTMRDHYIARLVDLFDLAALALRASQP